MWNTIFAAVFAVSFSSTPARAGNYYAPFCKKADYGCISRLYRYKKVFCEGQRYLKQLRRWKVTKSGRRRKGKLEWWCVGGSYMAKPGKITCPKGMKPYLYAIKPSRTCRKRKKLFTVK